MPMFEYHCISCGHEFEELILSAAAEGSVKCPGCGSADVHKKMSCFSGRVGSAPSGSAGPGPPNCGYT